MTLATLLLLLLLPTFGTSLPVTYQCPEVNDNNDDAEDAATDDANANNEKSKNTKKTGSWNTRTDYANLHDDILTNLTEYLKTFRDSEFDSNSFTYTDYKNSMRPFKSKYYPKYLKRNKEENKNENPTLYESAHGIGMNLLMTLEILKEEEGIEGVTVYGNEYIDTSTIKARHVLDSLQGVVANWERGMICTGDSTDLSSFVPEDSFDVVYTGYISPMINPLELTLSQDENYAWYRTLCEATDDENDYIYWRNVAQQIQNDWFGKWVGEMVRIAKPGGAVIVEQIAVPYCECYIDWGGVPQSFWKETLQNNTYGWDVDPDSLVIELDTMYVKRYHVVMEKNKKKDVDVEAEEEVAS
eukprot:CAMPEP_0117034274 /NCGR_PEP_ID=MMETSP0472-20121206/24418_1 /TAXON_ID=693140 ORGANISM="Tiarina fusus, Strain LIS" /NCGR_SAMPLE_ID=MMETSP0472 /ASSEMBLY_ACC=CAM_ASM_000603 /LENGTH=355 /DNA_ID=CAMNT_0004743407 /DNA_START=281 /DNA_END=1344 /DNA_ORIENTATION=-